MILTMQAMLRLIRQITDYARYVARTFKAFYVILSLMVLALVLEYLATSLMIPLAPGGASAASSVVRVWTTIAVKLGFEPESRLWLWFFFIVMLARLSLGYMLNVLTLWLGKRVHREFSGKIFGHILLSEPMEKVYKRSIGHYIALAGDDTFKSGTIVSYLLQTGTGCLTALVSMLVLYQFSANLFIGILAFLLFSAILIAFLMRQVIRINGRATELSRELNTTFVEALNSLRSIRSLHGERFIMGTYAEQIRAYVRMLVEIDAVRIAVRIFPGIILLLLAILFLRPGQQQGITDATLLASTVIIARLFGALGQMITAGSQLVVEIRSVKDINALIAISEEKQSAPEEQQSLQAHAAIRSLKLHDVSFGYDQQNYVLDGLNFHFQHGHTYAIVGPSGSGKSTLADLMLGLVSPLAGEVSANDGATSLELARSRVVLVEQQPKIFSTSIRDNLLMGQQAPDEELYEALDIVNLSDMVKNLEDSLNTRLAYLGENFSGGQRQRLGIARALVRHPDILILDEATSALDPETRSEVVAKLRTKMRDGIIVFITHDPEIAELADEILSIDATPLAMTTKTDQ